MKKKLISSLASVIAVLTLLICAVSSFGWFSSNQRVNTSGMSMRVSVMGNLVISDNSSDIGNSEMSQINGGSPQKIVRVTDTHRYYPATHSADYTNHPTGLKRIDNSEVIDLNSGINKEDETIRYANAANTETTRYFVDYDVYVASFGSDLSDAALKVTMDSAQKEVDGSLTDITAGSLMATSVDFYADSVASANYRGTLNVAGLDLSNDYPKTFNKTATKTEVPLADSIPNNKEGSLHFVLRFYFDGALQSAEDQTYIYTARLDCSKTVIGLTFTAVN